ncbi:LPXTG cell wall anchor domain-containing protein [Lactobacillus helveticus]|uniref:LPXTG cell wall anchor domain-containing protein n=1 Tax=Lactobacillus helveticus TaxID=1587 RepID=UPI003AF340D5
MPEAVSTEKTQVTQKEEALPETGEKDSSKAGAILSSLAAALGITGLAGTSKKRKKKDE